jgi:hypothetical protein
MSTSINLVSELERLASALDSEAAGDAPISLVSVAERIARNLGVKTQEVGILAISSKWKHLYFLVPEALRNVGFIPISSTSSLAARTARESRPEINNAFAGVRHASIFESVKIGETVVEAIQKIVSAPILSNSRVVGVIQISRRGADPRSAGPDFTSGDLGTVLAICKPLGKLLQHIAVE